MDLNSLPSWAYWQWGLSVITLAFVLYVIYFLIRVSMREPQLEADWEGDCAFMSEVDVKDDLVNIANFRDFHWRTTRDRDEIWIKRSVNIAQLENIWYVVDHFSSMKGMAHIMLSFEFKDGNHLAASFECRRRKGQRYDPWKGLWRNYELCLVWGTERDLIGLRTNVRGNKVHLYRVTSTPEKKKALFLELCNRSQQLATKAEWYNSLFTTCLTSIVQQVNRITPNRIPLTWRYLLPGHSTRAALRLGLIEDWGGYRKTVKQGELEALERESTDDEFLFSKMIRERMPNSSTD